MLFMIEQFKNLQCISTKDGACNIRKMCGISEYKKYSNPKRLFIVQLKSPRPTDGCTVLPSCAHPQHLQHFSNCFMPNMNCTKAQFSPTPYNIN